MNVMKHTESGLMGIDKNKNVQQNHLVGYNVKLYLVHVRPIIRILDQQLQVICLLESKYSLTAHGVERISGF